MPSHTRASSRPISGRSSAAASVPSGGPPSRATRPISPPSTTSSGGCSPATRCSCAGSSSLPSVSPFRAGLMINGLVRSGAVSAPVVLGRDHLDSGSVASPYRETEAMRDGSDAIADWPILNALLNTAAGATWVSVHHGGGVGIGNSIHAGMVVLADGSADAAERLERVLTTDPGTGVMRHADAGYDEALDAARAHGLDLPSADSPGV